MTITKETSIQEASRVFLLQIQRWDDFGSKNNKHCAIPEFLDLSNGISKLTTEQMDETGSQRDLFAKLRKTIQQKSTHRLVAVICHAGVANYGHYYCYTHVQGVWRNMNDESAQKVQFDQIGKGEEAMFLVYEKTERAKSCFQLVQQSDDLVIQPVQQQPQRR